jgi:hypothetical protein
MKLLTGAVLVVMLVATPVWAAGVGEFDPDQPFKGLGQRLLESILSQALEALDDHFEIAGNFDTGSTENNQQKNLKFKFYPNGKSKSDEHIAAEGWFGPSKDSRQEEFHFRFTVPKSLTEPPTDLPDNVL